MFEGLVELVRGRSEVAAADDVQRAVEVLAGRLSGECLADTGRTEEVDDETLALAADEIVEGTFAARAQPSVRLDERAQQRLPLGRQDQTRKRLVVPVDRRDMVDVVLNYVEFASAATREQMVTLLTPQFVRQTKPIDDRRGEEELIVR